VINLHAAYEAQLGHTKVSAPAGIVYARGVAHHTATPLATGRGGTGCAEPHCPVFLQPNGWVQLHPHIYLLLWGPNWTSDPNQAAAASYLESFYAGLGVEPTDNWSTVTSQYGDATGSPAFDQPVYQGFWQDTNPPPTGATLDQIAAEADSFATAQGITDLADAQIVVATQSGTCPAGFEAPTCDGGSGTFCSEHAYSNEPFIDLPYVLDAGTDCGEDFVNANGTYDGFSMFGGHEYAETITDPEPFTGWWDPNDQSGGEIADKCVWSPNSADVTLSTGNFAMQPLWSNSANGKNGSCVMPTGGGSDLVAVATPGNQTNYYGTALSLDISGTSSDGYPLTWTAQGLPTGLEITSSGTPAVISGQIEAAPGVYSVTVIASDSTGSSALTTFNWTVTADVGKDIKNTAAGLCLNDYGAYVTSGNEIVMYTCRPTGPAEMFTHPTNPGELIVLGECVTDHSGGAAGALMMIEPCATTPPTTQEWDYNSDHEWVLEKNHLCLTDLNGSKLNGEPTRIEKCTDATDQRWPWS
jgi:serine protease